MASAKCSFGYERIFHAFVIIVADASLAGQSEDLFFRILLFSPVTQRYSMFLLPVNLIIHTICLPKSRRGLRMEFNVLALLSEPMLSILLET